MKRSTITALRDLVPLKPLNRWELIALAQDQAERFLELEGIEGPAVPNRIVTDLPKVRVEHHSPMPVSGMTHWTGKEWLVILNSAEPLCRQRFSLFHEAKHVIDHKFVDTMYKDFEPLERHLVAEQMCDYFAGCVLVPRPWLEEAWRSGTRDVMQLALQFDVSRPCMEVRLRQLGLIGQSSRCAPPTSPGWKEAIAAVNKPRNKRVLSKITT